MSNEIAPDHLWVTEEAAARVKRHPGTIRRACLDGSLHGEQPKKRGHWLIEEQCLNAYKRGADCAHRENVTKISKFKRRSA